MTLTITLDGAGSTPLAAFSCARQPHAQSTPGLVAERFHPTPASSHVEFSAIFCAHTHARAPYAQVRRLHRGYEPLVTVAATATPLILCSRVIPPCFPQRPPPPTQAVCVLPTTFRREDIRFLFCRPPRPRPAASESPFSPPLSPPHAPVLELVFAAALLMQYSQKLLTRVVLLVKSQLSQPPQAAQSKWPCAFQPRPTAATLFSPGNDMCSRRLCVKSMRSGKSSFRSFSQVRYCMEALLR